MAGNSEDRQGTLDGLITEVATALMGVALDNLAAVSDEVMVTIQGFFGVDAVFLRRHDLERRVAILEAEYPPRPIDFADDPFIEVHFDDNPTFAMGEHLTVPLIIYPDGGQFDEFIEEASGTPSVTVAVVPLLRGGSTIGGLGLVQFGMRSFEQAEVAALSAIATLFAQLWGRLEAEQSVMRQAYFDPLTGLPNRLRLVEQIETLEQSEWVSFISIDIDNMKVVNDGLDYGVGDQFIQRMARRLEANMRSDDLVVRLQGDQLGALIIGLPPERVDMIANRLVGDLSTSVLVGDINLARSVSIGVAHNSVSAQNADLLAESEAALHLAKLKGKNRAVTFDSEMRAKVLHRFEVELELREALERDELTLHYQPVADLVTGKIIAVEALLRWQHPKRGLQAAGSFIDVAEESGLVIDIGDVVMAKAIEQLSKWQKDHPDLEMWINVSPAQLMSRDLAYQVETLLLEHNVPSSAVCLEVTEHVILDDIESTRGALERLRTMGVKLALDDFGTGYSSMKQLKSLPITALKIDMSFIAGLGVSDHDSAIVDAAVTLADAFGLDSIAEGIEEPKQILELRKRGCDKGQGYFLAHPAAPEKIEMLLGQSLTMPALADGI